MKEKYESPIYSKIALDIAFRISKGEIKEGVRLSGRSVLAGEYKVSPETIRKSLRILEDVAIVKVLAGSGAEVVSRSEAASFIEQYNTGNDLRSHRNDISSLIKEREELDLRLLALIDKVYDLSERLKNISPVHAVELEIPEGSPIVGKTATDLKFWQRTGATIVAIKRQGKVIISPGPYASFIPLDIVLVIGDKEAPERVSKLIREG
jgi:K+/H+ antiporter YhaU regulatory subunit KhtT